MSMTEAQAEQFYKRLARIDSSAAHVADGLLAPGELDYIRAKQGGKKLPKAVRKRAKSRIKGQKKSSFSRVMFAFALGMFVCLFARVLDFKVAQDAVPMLAPYKQIFAGLGVPGIALLVGSMLISLSGIRKLGLFIAFGIGFAAFLYGEPIAALFGQPIWAELYSPNTAVSLAGTGQGLIASGVEFIANYGIELPDSFVLPEAPALPVDLGF